MKERMIKYFKNFTTSLLSCLKIRSILSIVKQKLYKNPRPAINDLDRKLEKYLNYRDGYFIECGSNDGYSQSNTYFLEKELNWRGLLVEGIPELYEKCKKERTRSIVHNCALVSCEFPHPTATMHYAHLMSVVDGSLKTQEAQEKHLADGIDMQHLDDSYSIVVPARTLESILDENEYLSEIDFFSLDVEGYELNVLKGLNLSKYRPTYILVEAIFFEEVNKFLEEHDYKMIEKFSNYDYLYKTNRNV